MKKSTVKRKILRHIGKVFVSAFTTVFLLSPSSAVAIDIEPVEAIAAIGANEGAKAALNEALKIARSKPALSVASTVVCLACVPAAGVTSPCMCIACGILIAKVVG